MWRSRTAWPAAVLGSILVHVVGAIIVTIIGFIVSTRNEERKINGANLVSPPKPITIGHFDPLLELNANWVSIIPYGFSYKNEPDVYFDHEKQWWGERTDGVKTLIQYAREKEMKIMLKPHVWVMGDGWTGNYDLSSEADWEVYH